MASKEISFNDLSLGLKIAIILAWITGSLTTISFFVGFFSGLLY